MLEEMRNHEEGFFHFAQRESSQFFDYFKSRELSAERQQYFDSMCRESLLRQKEIESSDVLSFDEYLKQYFSNN